MYRMSAKFTIVMSLFVLLILSACGAEEPPTEVAVETTAVPSNTPEPKVAPTETASGTHAPTETATPTLEPIPAFSRPLITIKGYGLDTEAVNFGQNVDLWIQLQNSGQQYAHNIVVTFVPGDLVPRGTGGVITVSEIAPGNHTIVDQPLSGVGMKPGEVELCHTVGTTQGRTQVLLSIGPETAVSRAQQHDGAGWQHAVYRFPGGAAPVRY